MRHDLLSLTLEDLALLANRGLARRAQQELAAGDLQVELSEDAGGTVTARWSDEVTCILPGDRPASAGRCSCPSTTICRHVLRSILAYQQWATAADAPSAPPEPWDPGAIGDAELERLVARAALTWARKAYAEGQVVELVRAVKPTATLHNLACTVRFLVPGDVRYTHCDCAEPAPCRHVPLALWAFRRLEPGRAGGIVETADRHPAAPVALLDALDASLRELMTFGVAGAPQPLVEGLRRLEQRCRAEGLAWPAEAIAELAHEHAAYSSHDARFDPARVAALVGELSIRADAIRSATGAIPQLFVRGGATDTETAVKAARLVGLGVGARVRRGGVDLAAYLQDADSGALVAVVKEHVDPAPDSGAAPSSFAQLARASVARGVTLAGLGAGQALVKGGKRLPNARFVPGRALLTLNPQAYAWEALHAPAFAEDIAELTARLAAQPPAALRPRRVTDGLCVCAVAGVEVAAFAVAEQAVRATLRDARGELLTLRHPYHTRARGGAAALLAALQSRPGELRFVAGHVALGAAGPVIAPTALVFQEGASRRAVLPWVDQEPGEGEVPELQGAAPSRREPIADYWAQVEQGLGELLVVGLRSPDLGAARRWRTLALRGAGLGFGRLIAPIETLATELERRQAALHWQPETAVTSALRIARLVPLVGGALAVGG